MSDNDILNQINEIDLSTVQTGFPLLATGIVSLLIVGFEDDVSGDAPIKKVKLSLAEPWKEVDGTPVNVGFPVTDFIRFNVWHDEKTGKDKNFGVQRLAELRAAVFGKAKPGDRFDQSALVNQTVQASLKYDPAPRNKKTGQTYGPQTVIERYLTKK